MKIFKKLITISMLTATLSTSIPLLGAISYQGSGYEDSYRASRISPTVVVGTAALATGIAILVHNRKRHHHHSSGGSGGGDNGGGGTGHGHSHS